MKKIFLVIILLNLVPSHTASSFQIEHKKILNIQKIRTIWGKKIQWKNCPRIIRPSKNIDVTPYYGNKKIWKKTVKPYYQYAEKISFLTDLYIISKPENIKIAQCALSWLHLWAENLAMTGQPIVGNQSIYVRKWLSGSIAMSYFKLQNLKFLNENKKRRIEKWISILAELIADSSTGPSSAKNNHAYWNSFSNMINGIVLKRKDLIETSLSQYEIAIDEMLSEGILPLELKRGENSLHYHNFSLEPLIFTAELGSRIGKDAYSLKSNLLFTDKTLDIHTLANLIILSIQNPDYFKRFTEEKLRIKKKGTISKFFNDPDLSWMEIYYTRFKDKRLIPYIKRLRKLNNFKKSQNKGLRNWRIGGNATVLWGTKKLLSR